MKDSTAREAQATTNTLLAFHRAMFDHFGPLGWWPAKTALEVIVGAILTQNTAWTNVEKAIGRLRDAGCLTWDKLQAMSLEQLEEAIRPSGTYRVKARRLKAFVDWLFAECDGDLDALFSRPAPALRRRLLSVHGIGPETADAILLYAANMPSFVVDAYTRRILIRHGLIEPSRAYDEIKALFERHLPADARLFNAYHAELVEVGKRYCRTAPDCDRCPLRIFEHRI